jgi:hypothetical protein
MFDCGPGTASFALVAWSMKQRHDRWSFWRRGTGEKHLYHHCKGNDDTCPVDSLYAPGLEHCRDCKAKPPKAIMAKYAEFKRGRKVKPPTSDSRRTHG